jgi:signal recognition particle receptor subunit alpha
VVEYPFDKYFDQLIRELEDTPGEAIDQTSRALEEKKRDPLVLADNGGPPPPSAPLFLKGKPR